MSYALTISEEADHLHIKATRHRTIGSPMDIAREAVAACKQHQRFLLDMH